MDQTVPSGHPAVLPPLGYPFNPPTLYEGPIKFDPALPHFGAFPKPDGDCPVPLCEGFWVTSSPSPWHGEMVVGGCRLSDGAE